MLLLTTAASTATLRPSQTGRRCGRPPDILSTPGSWGGQLPPVMFSPPSPFDPIFSRLVLSKITFQPRGSVVVTTLEPLTYGKHASRTAQSVRAGRDRDALGRVLDQGKALPCANSSRRARAQQVSLLAASAQRDRAPAHGPHAEADRDGHHHPLASHARRSHALAAGHRPRRHRDADDGGAATRAPRARTGASWAARGVRRARVGVEASSTAAQFWSR